MLPLSFLTLTIFQQTSFAGPPFFTDDPEPVDYKHTEFYTASTLISDKSGKSGTLPHFEFNYGIWPEFQAHLITPASFNQPKNEGWEYGYGDTEVGLKYRFIQETPSIPQVGTFPIIEIPTGDSRQGLGNGKSQFFLPLWLQKSWGPWTTYGGGGYWFNPGEDNKNWTFLGWELQRDLSKNLTLGTEIFYRTPDKIDGQSGLGLNTGVIYNINDHNHILFSAGTDVHGPRHATVYMAYQWTF